MRARPNTRCSTAISNIGALEQMVSLMSSLADAVHIDIGARPNDQLCTLNRLIARLRVCVPSDQNHIYL